MNLPPMNISIVSYDQSPIHIKSLQPLYLTYFMPLSYFPISPKYGNFIRYCLVCKTMTLLLFVDDLLSDN